MKDILDDPASVYYPPGNMGLEAGENCLAVNFRLIQGILLGIG